MSPLTTASGDPLPSDVATAALSSPPEDPELAAAEAEVLAAERALEDAADGEDPRVAARAQKRLVTARTAVELIRAAVRGRARRGEEEAAASAARREAAARASYLEWSAEWVRRVKPVLELRQQLEEVERYLDELGSRPLWPGDRATAHAAPWQGLPVQEALCARSIPDSVRRIGRPGRLGPLLAHNVTVEKVGREEGPVLGSNPRIIERMSGEDRLDRLAAAIDELAAMERDAAGDAMTKPGWA
jgi:hypothetical protein